jgi:hypothetical protein
MLQMKDAWKESGTLHLMNRYERKAWGVTKLTSTSKQF